MLKSEIGLQMAELAHIEKIQKSANVEAPNRKKILLFIFEKIKNDRFIMLVPISHYLGVFLQTITTLGLTQLHTHLFSRNVNFGQICKYTRNRVRLTLALVFDTFIMLKEVVLRC